MRIVLGMALALSLWASSCKTDGPNGNSANRNAAASNRNANRVGDITPPPELIPKTTPDVTFKACNEYFPLVPGSRAKYAIIYSSGVSATATVVVDADQQNGQPVFLERTQIVDQTGGIHKKSLQNNQYSCADGKVQLVSQVLDNEADGNQSHIQMRFAGPATTFVEPTALKPGTTWSYSFGEIVTNPGQAPFSPDTKYTVVYSATGEQDISVPAGTFKTMKVEKKVNGRVTIYEYYARGIGLVQRENQDGTAWKLKEFSGIRASD
jgi:hypothetical protein